jgi:hypothetical protein
MPHVPTTSVEGPTPEQKRKIAEGMTNVLIDDGRAKRENTPWRFMMWRQRITRKRHESKGREVKRALFPVQDLQNRRCC